MPITFTRIVRTGLSSTVSTPAIAAQWTMCVAPADSSRIASASSTSAWCSVKFGWSASGVPESASRCMLSAATISFSSTSRRASVVAMKPAPPVMKIFLPLSTRRVYRRATLFQIMRMTLLIAVLIAAIGCGASQGTAGSTPETELTITFWPDGRDADESKDASKKWTLRCSPPVARCRGRRRRAGGCSR